MQNYPVKMPKIKKLERRKKERKTKLKREVKNKKTEKKEREYGLSRMMVRPFPVLHRLFF